MLEVLAVVLGVALVLAALADMLSTLVTTQTSQARWWLTSQIYRRSWSGVRRAARRIRDERVADRLLGTFAPLSVLLLLTAWVVTADRRLRSRLVGPGWHLGRFVVRRRPVLLGRGLLHPRVRRGGAGRSRASVRCARRSVRGRAHHRHGHRIPPGHVLGVQRARAEADDPGRRDLASLPRR